MNEKLLPNLDLEVILSLIFSLDDLSKMNMKNEKKSGMNKNLPI